MAGKVRPVPVCHPAEKHLRALVVARDAFLRAGWEPSCDLWRVVNTVHDEARAYLKTLDAARMKERKP